MSEKPPSDVPLPYADRPVATAPGHWVLARAGKRVLRPGGAALTARRELWETVEDLRDRGVSVLLTTQYLDEAERLSDDIVLIRDGSKVMQGAPAALRQQFGELRAPHRWLSQSHDFKQIRRKDCFWEICPHEAIIPQRGGR